MYAHFPLYLLPFPSFLYLSFTTQSNSFQIPSSRFGLPIHFFLSLSSFLLVLSLSLCSFSLIFTSLPIILYLPFTTQSNSFQFPSSRFGSPIHFFFPFLSFSFFSLFLCAHFPFYLLAIQGDKRRERERKRKKDRKGKKRVLAN